MSDERNNPDLAHIERAGLTIELWDPFGDREKCRASVLLDAALFGADNRSGLCVASAGDDVFSALYSLAWELDHVYQVLKRCGQRESAAAVDAMQDCIRRLPDEIGYDVTIDEIKAMNQNNKG